MVQGRISGLYALDGRAYACRCYAEFRLHLDFWPLAGAGGLVSAGPVAVPATRRLARVGAISDVVALGFLAIVCLALVVITWRTWGSVPEDAGYDLSAAARTAHGSLPYVDYTYSYGPIAPLLLGGLFAALGVSLGVAEALGVVLATATVAGTYGLARQRMAVLPSALAAAVIAPIVFSSGGGSPIFNVVLPHTFSAPIAALFTMGVLAALTAFVTRGRTFLLALAGIALGLTAVARPEAALAPVGAILLWLALRAYADRRVREAVRQGVTIALPALAVAIVGYGPFLFSVSPRTLLWTNLYPVDILHAGGNTVISETAPFTLHSAVVLIGFGALYAVLAAVCIAVGRGRVWLLVAGLGLLILAAAAARAGGGANGALHHITDLAYRPMTLIAIVAVALAARPALRRGATFTAVQQADLLLAAFLLAASIRTYALFAPGSDAIYTFPLAAIVLVRLHVTLPKSTRTRLAGALWIALVACVVAALGARDAHRATYTVQTPHGAFRTTPAQGQPFSAALRIIERDTKPGDAVLVAPQLQALEVLSGRRSALPQLSLLPGALPDAAAERQAIARLDKADVRVAVLDRRALKEYGNGAFGSTFDRVLHAWVTTRFHRVATVGGSGDRPLELDIWERSTP
jgi:hypothetical protein